jgi:hypothetical protein
VETTVCVPDPCAGASCPAHAKCTARVSDTDPSALACHALCDDGFYFAADQTCVSSDPCAEVECPANASCAASGKDCRATCRAGFVATPDGSACAPARKEDACAAVDCPATMVCTQVGDECIGHCKEGFVADRVTRQCVRPAGDRRLCPVGYHPNDEKTSCLPINACAMFAKCPANAVCEDVSGKCITTCRVGFGIDYVTRTCMPLESKLQ